MSVASTHSLFKVAILWCDAQSACFGIHWFGGGSMNEARLMSNLMMYNDNVKDRVRLSLVVQDDDKLMERLNQEEKS